MSREALQERVTRLDAFHIGHGCVRADIFAPCKEEPERDFACGCDFPTTTYGGMFNDEEHGILPGEADEELRLVLAGNAYQLAKELKQ